MEPIASLSCDLDDRWAYMKTRGNPAWEKLPSYLEAVVPRILSCLHRQGLRSTVFIVGQDAALERNRELLGAIAEAGHEIGNHSFHHDPWLHRYSHGQIARELDLAEEHIERATGYRPVGFRGPGYSLSETTITELAQRGYLYDASTWPTFVGPLARAYFLATGRFTAEELDLRKSMFGGFREGFRRLRPYKWNVNGKSLIEVPVTTMPFLKFPIHISYVLALSLCSQSLARWYFQASLSLCRVSGVQPSILLHPLDFLGREQSEGVEFFPGMTLATEQKLEFVTELLQHLRRRFRVVPVREHAMSANQETILSVMDPAL